MKKRLAQLEGGLAAVAVSSGQAASAFAIQNLCQAGDNIVSSTDLYGGTWNQFENTFKKLGIEVRFANPKDPMSFLLNYQMIKQELFMQKHFQIQN